MLREKSIFGVLKTNKKQKKSTIKTKWILLVTKINFVYKTWFWNKENCSHITKFYPNLDDQNV